MITPNSVKEQITLMADAEIAFGVCATRTAANAELCKITEAAETVVGITVHRHNDTGVYAEGAAVGVLTKGSIAVPTEGAGIDAGVKAYWNPATAKFTSVDTATIEVGVFQSAVKNDSLATVKIDIVA